MAKHRSRYDETEAKPANDAYTGLLALSLIALLASCVVLYLDYAQYGATEGPKVNIPKPNPPSGAPSGTSQTPARLIDLVAEPLPLPALDGPIVPVANVESAADEGPALTPPD
jgi:hypothetical protein